VSETQAVILAGGPGTRLRPMTEAIPKPMVPVNGKPFLEYEIGLLQESGIGEFVLCIGYLGETIQNYFGNGHRLGVRIRYSYDGPKLLGPVGALKQSESLLEESFFVTYGDAYLRAPYRRIMDSLLASKKLGLMTVYQNNNRYGKSDVVVEGGYVVRFDKKNQKEEMNWINFGVSALTKPALELIPSSEEYCEEEFYRKLIERKELLAFPVTNRFYEIGNPTALMEFEKFISEQQL
jgi:NDP-sugar pyrophosphorylase family protein